MQSEYDTSMKNHTLYLVPKSHYQKIIDYRCLHKTKTIVSGDLDKHKSRLVIEGYL